jgi:uncharacterized protein (TIGR01244 family)
MKKRLCLVALLFLIPQVAFAQAETSSIKNFLRINKDFCTGGQPSLEHLQKLKDEGVRTIINLRVPTEYNASEEEEMAKKLGLGYYNIPVSSEGPKNEQVAEFLKITDDEANRPSFIHCGSAARVGAFWMIRRVLRDKWTLEAAEEEAKKIGLRDRPKLIEFARKYIKDNSVKK